MHSADDRLFGSSALTQVTLNCGSQVDGACDRLRLLIDRVRSTRACAGLARLRPRRASYVRHGRGRLQGRRLPRPECRAKGRGLRRLARDKLIFLLRIRARGDGDGARLLPLPDHVADNGRPCAPAPPTIFSVAAFRSLFSSRRGARSRLDRRRLLLRARSDR